MGYLFIEMFRAVNYLPLYCRLKSIIYLTVEPPTVKCSQLTVPKL